MNGYFSYLYFYMYVVTFKAAECCKMRPGVAIVAELVDALDLGSSPVRGESSSLSFRTMVYFIRL